MLPNPSLIQTNSPLEVGQGGTSLLTIGFTFEIFLFPAVKRAITASDTPRLRLFWHFFTCPARSQRSKKRIKVIHFYKKRFLLAFSYSKKSGIQSELGAKLQISLHLIQTTPLSSGGKVDNEDEAAAGQLGPSVKHCKSTCFRRLCLSEGLNIFSGSKQK